MKAKLAGLGLLLLVIVLAVGYTLLGKSRETMELTGYVGGEKIGLLEDEEVQKLLQRKYHLEIDYSRAGSIEMVTEDHTGMDFLFPSSQTALEIYEAQHGKPVKSEIVLNTPIVLYARAAVADALLAEGIAREEDGVCYVDMQKLAACIEEGTPWSEIGLPELVRKCGGIHHRSHEIQFRQYVRGPSGQHPLRRHGGRELSYGDPSQAADDFSEPGLYGKLFFRLI